MVTNWVQNKGCDLLFITIEGREEGDYQLLVIGEPCSENLAKDVFNPFHMVSNGDFPLL